MSEGLSVWEAILLGIVQGVTEWLPVSSSGHLVLAQEFLGIEAPLVFELLVHVGTLLVVLVFFRNVIGRMLRQIALIPRDLKAGASWRDAVWGDPERRLAVLVLVGTFPTAVAGLLLESRITGAFENLTAVGVALLFTGTLIWATRYVPTDVPPRELTLGRAFLVGAAQGLALFPGVSRSGTTITASLFQGVDREVAVQYSFLLAIPAIVGASILQLFDPAARADFTGNLAPFLAGTVAAMVVGYACLVLLVMIVRKRALHWFAPYCWALGAFVLARGFF